MSKFGLYNEYPERGLAQAESTLLTVWPGLARHHEDLVLVGGLAVHCLTRPHAGGYPVAVTMDADLGISLAAGGGIYGPISTDLLALGFRPSETGPNRFERRVEDTRIYLDFLTEDPPAIDGSRMVDDVVASVVPGINRALANPRIEHTEGPDLYGVTHTIPARVADIGPLLVLKINAFGGPRGRRHPKDAYDLLLAVTAFVDGPEKAIEGFLTEAQHRDPAYQTAIEALRRDFVETTNDGPVRASEFLRGTFDDLHRIREDVVTVARALLGE